MKRITIVGTGYVGLSNAVLLSQRNEFLRLEIFQIKEENSIVYDVKGVLADVDVKLWWRMNLV